MQRNFRHPGIAGASVKSKAVSPLRSATALHRKGAQKREMQGEAGAALLAQEIVLEYAAQGTETVAPADFFPLGVSAAVVGDGDLVDADV